MTMRKLTVWLLVLLVGICTGLLMTYWLTSSRQTSKAHIAGLSKQNEDVKGLQLIAEARFIELATKVTITQMTPTQQGWLIEIDIDSRVAKETDVLDLLLELLDELQRSQVKIAQAGAKVYSDALRDELGRRISNLLIARMQVSQPTLTDAEWQHVKHEHMPAVLDELWINPMLKPDEKPE
jgi:hypothetical protein